MGNGNSSGFLSLNGSAFNTGDIVSGTFYLSVGSPLSVNSVSVRICGTEKVSWSELEYDPVAASINRRAQMMKLEGRTEAQISHALKGELSEWRARQLITSNFSFCSPGNLPESRSIPVSGGRDLLIFSVAVGGAGELNGQYSFPFRFQLPSNCPGTFEYRQGDVSASISYKVEGFVDASGMLSSDLKYSVPVHVFERPQQIRPVFSSNTSNVMCCCFSKGQVSFDVRTTKDGFSSGERLEVVANVNNQSQKDVDSVVVELYSNLELRAGGKRKSIPIRVASSKGEGIPSGSNLQGMKLGLVVPLGIKQQALGFDLRHFYSVKVRAKISWATDPECIVPIGIYKAATDALPVAPQMQAPANWQPQEQPVVVIEVPALQQSPQGIDLNLFQGLHEV